MKRYLKEYQVVVHTVGPVFVGSGREIGKKEYIFLNNNRMGIPDSRQLYTGMQKRGKAKDFEDYLLYNNKDDLKRWLGDQRISVADIKPFLRYTLDCDDLVVEKGKRLQIMECMKDPYGKPYIPGTTLKGMLRTILLAEDILRNDIYEGEKCRVKNILVEQDNRKINRNSYLKRESSQIEAKAYRILEREDTKPEDAVNDYLQGLMVSDSEPLTEEDLVLCQRIELHTDGERRGLPLLRECIKPGRDIKFTITVDETVCSVNDKILMQAVRLFSEQYNQNFSNAFDGAAKLKENSVLLGGGSGFVSKTVVYPMYGKKEGIEIVKKIFDKTNVPRQHKHAKDTEYGASPHILKCTNYKGKTVQMGVCEIRIT